jgi:hypothetical protein
MLENGLFCQKISWSFLRIVLYYAGFEF